jgi:hypothetical protein
MQYFGAGDETRCRDCRNRQALYQNRNFTFLFAIMGMQYFGAGDRLGPTCQEVISAESE